MAPLAPAHDHTARLSLWYVSTGRPTLTAVTTSRAADSCAVHASALRTPAVSRRHQVTQLQVWGVAPRGGRGGGGASGRCSGRQPPTAPPIPDHLIRPRARRVKRARGGVAAPAHPRPPEAPEAQQQRPPRRAAVTTALPSHLPVPNSSRYLCGQYAAHTTHRHARTCLRRREAFRSRVLPTAQPPMHPALLTVPLASRGKRRVQHCHGGDAPDTPSLDSRRREAAGGCAATGPAAAARSGRQGPPVTPLDAGVGRRMPCMSASCARPRPHLYTASCACQVAVGGVAAGRPRWGGGAGRFATPRWVWRRGWARTGLGCGVVFKGV